MLFKCGLYFLAESKYSYFIVTFYMQQTVYCIYVLLLIVSHHLSDCYPHRVQNYVMTIRSSKSMLKLLCSFASSTWKFHPRQEANENYC